MKSIGITYLVRVLVLLFLASGWAVAQKSAAATQAAKPTTLQRDAQTGPIRVYFGPKAADDPAGVLYNLLKFIDSAQTSLYGSAHEVDMLIVAERLAARAAAGVDVQVVVEARWMTLPKDRAAMDVLKNSRVRLIPDTKKSGLMHNKFFVADKKRVWTGSTNITEHCLLFNYNNGVWIEDERVAANFLTEFYEQREGKFGKKGSGKPNTPYPMTTVGTARVATFFSPEDTPLPQIVSMIERAKKTIDVYCFVFSSKEIAEALIAAHKRGVKVRVLLDNSFSSHGSTARWRYVPYKELAKAEVPVKYDDEEAKLHHKVIVVDGVEVLTGSFNLSNNAAKSNDENILIIYSPEIAGRYQAEFERLWSTFSGDPGEAPEPDDEDESNADEAGGSDNDDN
ncbi:MAG: phospholipase D-like domain-containing protein [Acidobacteriota bacterium]|nr:phospholipase D-like domain-containing protein [Blastocatellia bacterium]MDW8413046.1 phospholipase D-like domain-containing protein [Acidobacteriota bacterium]